MNESNILTRWDSQDVYEPATGFTRATHFDVLIAFSSHQILLEFSTLYISSYGAWYHDGQSHNHSTQILSDLHFDKVNLRS